MPRPKRPDYNPPADLLGRLPGKPIITLGDKLAALNTMFHRCEIGWRDLHLSIINAIREDIRLSAWRKREQAQKDSAPVQAGAPSSPNESSEAGSSIAASPLERKISFGSDGDLIVHCLNGVGLSWRIGGTDTVLLHNLTPDDADQLAAALTELAGDLRQDVNARAWSQDLLNTTG